jgi:hypothetical protein
VETLNPKENTKTRKIIWQKENFINQQNLQKIKKDGLLQKKELNEKG